MRHCEPCEMPDALASTGERGLHRQVKHAIIEAREFRNDLKILEYLRARHEAHGTLEIFEAAQKCVKCAEGMCLLFNNEETGWKVGGESVTSDSET
jgi:hypothetical protein